MSDQQHTAAIIAEAWNNIMRGTAMVNEALAAVASAQKECRHTWVFSRQVNAHHETLWWVVYRCPACSLERTDKKEPVCEDDDTLLVRADAADTEAEAERRKPEYQGHYSSPVAFRCPTCGKIHILHYRGD